MGNSEISDSFYVLSRQELNSNPNAHLDPQVTKGDLYLNTGYARLLAATL